MCFVELSLSSPSLRQLLCDVIMSAFLQSNCKPNHGRGALADLGRKVWVEGEVEGSVNPLYLITVLSYFMVLALLYYSLLPFTLLPPILLQGVNIRVIVGFVNLDSVLLVWNIGSVEE